MTDRIAEIRAGEPVMVVIEWLRPGKTWWPGIVREVSDTSDGKIVAGEAFGPSGTITTWASSIDSEGTVWQRRLAALDAAQARVRELEAERDEANSVVEILRDERKRALHDWVESSQKLREVSAKLVEMAASDRRSAASLRGEVVRGVTIRQSAESKLARADVLETHADQMGRLAAEIPVTPSLDAVIKIRSGEAFRAGAEAMRDAVVEILVEDECDELIGSVRMLPLPDPESEVG